VSGHLISLIPAIFKEILSEIWIRGLMRSDLLHAICVTVLLAGCTDLTAVQNFATTASAISSDEPVLSSWPSSYDRVRSLAGTQAIVAISPDAARSFIDKERETTADAQLAVRAAQMLGLYLQTLAQLAGGSVTDVGKPASGIEESIQKLGGASKDVTAATDALALLLRAWQNKAVGDVVKAANAPVQTITSFLANTADAVRLANLEAKTQSSAYWTSVGVRSGNIYTQAILQRIIFDDDAYYQAQIEKAAVARTAFIKIGTDHAVLAMNADMLSSASATLKADQPLLQNALSALLK
jgi:hypothetical protein